MDNSLFLASLIILTIGVALPILLHFTRHLGPHPQSNKAKDQTYESGVPISTGDSFERFSVKYYLVAIIFILFDVEVVFMLPWAVNLRDLGFFGMMEMFTFMALLIAGLIYVYKKGALQWR
jgi:NADH-quinone oxidoreductase subunit A